MNCLDAETVAAWFDDGLSGAALEELRSHVAGCARCQALVGAMGRTRAAAPPAPERVSRWWLAWAVPAAAAATAVAIWIAVPRPPNVVLNPTASLREQEKASLQEQEKAPQLNAAAPSPAATAEPAPAAEAPRLSELQDSARKAETAAASATPSAPQVAQQEADSNVVGTLSAPAAPPAERREAAQASAGVARQLQARDAFAANPCGPMWPAPPADVAAQITAASAPSADVVCWAVGRGGVVLRSTDRETWQRMNIPQALDLSGISAIDARTATVMAADGRTFSTADGGMTWNQP